MRRTRIGRRASIEDDSLHYQIYSNDNGRAAANYRNLVIAYRDGAAVRLSDVANVIDGAEDIHTLGLFNGQPGRHRERHAAARREHHRDRRRVKALLPQLEADLPGDIKLDVAIDRTVTIRASLHEVEITLLIALGCS